MAVILEHLNIVNALVILIGYHRIAIVNLIKRLSVLNKNAVSRARSDSCAEAKRNRNNNCARTADNECGKSSMKPLAPLTAHKKRRYNGYQNRNNTNNRRVYSRKFRYHLLGFALLIIVMTRERIAFVLFVEYSVDFPAAS